MNKRAVVNRVWEWKAGKKQWIYPLATQGIYKVTLPTERAAAWQTWSDAADAVRARAKRGVVVTIATVFLQA